MSLPPGAVALVTGGTRGLGAAAGIALARAGCAVVVTHRWGSIPDEDVAAAFTAAGAAPPLVIEADVADADDLARVLDTIDRRFGRVDVFVSNVCVAARGAGLDGFRARDLATTLDRSSWPLATHLDAIRVRFGRWPRTTIAMSSDGPDHFYPGYDYVATAKAALESLVATLAPAVADDGGRVFALRTRQVDTQSLEDMFAADVAQVLRSRLRYFLVTAEEMGEAVVALATGAFDGLHGGVLCADRGAGFFDSFFAVTRAIGEDPAAAAADAASGPDGDAPLVIPIEAGADARDASAIARLVETVRSHRTSRGALPRRVVAVQESAGDPAFRPLEAALDTALRYVSATHIFAPMSLNLVRHRPTAIGRERAQRTVAALGSGRLDHVRGQVLALHDD